MDEQAHLTNEEREAYWQRTLAPAALLEVSDHLQECERCREELRRARPSTARGEEPVDYEDLLVLMEEDLDPLSRREWAERIDSSPAAAAELADLQRFREEMNRLPSRDYEAAEESAGRFNWILPIAAGLALGSVFFWWTTMEHRQQGAITLRDAGEIIVVRQDGKVPALGPLPENLQQAVHAAATGQLVLSPVLDELRGKRGTLAGEGNAKSGFGVVAPVGTVIASTKPTFSWKPEPRANGYRINLVPQRSAEVVNSPVLQATQTEWTPPAALQPNESYEWEVEALRDGEMITKAPAPPAPEARFAILPNDKREALEKLRTSFGKSHLLMGLAYAQTGLLPQARTEFEQLAKENPKSELPKKLLAGLTSP